MSEGSLHPPRVLVELDQARESPEPVGSGQEGMDPDGSEGECQAAGLAGGSVPPGRSASGTARLRQGRRGM